MNDRDLYPVRDQHIRNMDHHIATGPSHQATQEGKIIARWTREELEDKYLRMYDENLLLKKHGRKQEDKIKRMATKLLRLVADKKKEQGDIKGKKGRDIETEEMLEELHGKIRELEKQNGLLKEKVQVTKQQLSTQGKRHTPYGHVGSRINTGIAKAPVSERISRNIRVAGPPREPKETGMNSPTLPRYGHSLLEEAREENRRLEEIIVNLQEQCNFYEQDIEILREQVRIKEAEFEEDLLKIKQQVTVGQRTSLQENVDLIRLQREIKEKSTKLTALQSKYSNLDEKLHMVTQSHEQVLSEMEELNRILKEEQIKSMMLQNELKHGTTAQKKIVEMQELTNDVQKENEILREANEKLVSSAFDMEREREWRQRENQLKVQIAQLEATAKADVGEKGGILDRLTTEREEHEQLEKEYRQLKIDYLTLKEQSDELREKMKFFTKESAVDFQEIEEALLLVKQKKERGAVDELDFLQKVDEEKNKDVSKQMLSIQAEYAETIEELEKTRNMLIVQHKINKDYQMEVEAVTRKMEENRQEYETKLQEYAQLLDIRQARIKKIESQMRDIAYGTKQYKVKPDEITIGDDTDDIDETLHLERGQNVFEIHISKVTWTAEGLQHIGDNEPNTFCTWEFYDFEIQSTPVVKGARPEFDFTSQYVVMVDDFFLHHLQKESTTLELHQAFGTDYRTVAACQMKFRDILDSPQGRVHGSARLAGIGDGMNGILFGNVEYWVRLKVPMDQALRLYKERTKALGYMATNERTANQALQALDQATNQRPSDNVNELHIKITRCKGISARRKGFQPSPYIVYKFFDFPDHDTDIVTNSNSPVLNDHRTYPVPMIADLDKYIKSQPLKIYLFDDTDPEETSYLGMAVIPLIPLSHDKPIKGTFELKRSDGSVNGSIDVQLVWQYTYTPPKVSTKTAAQILATTPMKPEKPLLMPGEDLNDIQSPLVAGPASMLKTPATLQQHVRETPVAMSTPIPIHQELKPQPPEPAAHVVPNILVDQQAPVRGPVLVRKKESVVYTSDNNTETDVEQETVVMTSTESVPPPQPKQRRRKEVDFAKETSSIEPESYDEIESKPIPKPKKKPAKAEPKPVPRAPPRRTESKPKSGSLEDEIMQEYDDDRTSDISEGSPVTGESVEVSSEFDEADDEAGAQEEESDEDVVVPKKPQVAQKKLSDDTMFEEVSEDDSITEEVDLPVSGEDDDSPNEIESDSEGVCVTPAPRSSSANRQISDTVTVTISSMQLNEGSDVINDPSIKMLFVEYRFLGFPPEELETPFSLPKPRPQVDINFHFKKVFYVDMENNYEHRQYLASMLLDDDPDEGRIRFTVISEPVEADQSTECEDVGVAFVSVRDILKRNSDFVDEDIPIYSVDESEEVGKMRITIECLAALRAVKAEMEES